MKISILGSTGSIGTQALEVVDDLKEIKDIEVVGLSANSNIKLLEAQIRKYNPKIVAVMDEDKAKLLKTAVSDTKTTVVCGESGLIDVSTHNDVDMVLSAIVGFAGLIPTMMAIEEGKDIALANKETLVTAGSIFMDAIKYNGVKLMPVDSEHCAIFQSLKAGNSSEVRKILLTASGGPFYGMTRDELKDITKKDALKHPNWSMGEKITVDSATLMNKGLEIMEARWLFNVPFDNIEVVVQRESIIHSMVEYVDNSVLAQMSLPSMKHPIQYAFTYPKRLTSNDESVSFSDIKNLSFGVADEETFRCLALAKQAGRAGGIMPTVLNAANEAAVAKFLAGEIKFLDIAEMVEDTMGKYKNIINPTLVDIIAINNDVRLRLATK